jgi:hypothetical protein
MRRPAIDFILKATAAGFHGQTQTIFDNPIVGWLSSCFGGFSFF